MSLTGIQLAILKPFTVEKAIDFAIEMKSKYGIDAVEISLEGTFDLPGVFIHQNEYKKLFAEKLRAFKSVGVHMPFMYLNPVAPDPAVAEFSIDQLKKSIDYAGDIGANYAVLHTPGWSHKLDDKGLRAEWKKLIPIFLDHAIKRNIILSVENVHPFIKLDLLAEMVRSFKSDNLKLTLDTGHAHFRVKHTRLQYHLQTFLDRYLPFGLIKKNIGWEKYGSLENFVKTEMDIINNFHIHDHNGKTDHICCGDGKIDFSFIKHIKNTNIPLIIETHCAKVDMLPDEVVERTFSFLNKNI